MIREFPLSGTNSSNVTDIVRVRALLESLMGARRLPQFECADRLKRI